MSDETPTVFGSRYELHRRLARGGMADVFLARDQLLDRPVAVKVLFREFATDPSFVERFRREAQAAANLTHPNIVSIYDWGAEGGTYYIVMEYVDGRSLAEVIRARGAIPPDRAATIASEVAAALGFAHRNGVVHRDVKPGNIILSPGGGVKVADFGIATAITGSAGQNLTQIGSVMGTATYFSPEQAQGRTVDQRSDLYSLGVVLYEMLNGQPPFSGDSPLAIAYKHVQEQPESLRSADPNVPESLEAITFKLLAKDPAVRYPTAGDLQADLRRYLDGQHNLSGPPVSVPASGIAAAAAAAAAAGAAPAFPGAAGGVGASVARAGAEGPSSSPAATQALPPVRPSQPPRTPTGHAPVYGGDEPPQRDFRIWLYALGAIVGLAAVVALVVFALNQLNDGDDDVAVERVTVPDLVDLSLDEAVALLTDLGLEADPRPEPRADVEPQTVLTQNPAADAEVDVGTTVVLFYAVAPDSLPVPDVVGLTEEEATELLEDAGFRVEVNEVADEAEPGTVLSQNPAAEADLEPGGTVVLQVSSGPEEIEIPEVVELPADQAEALLEDAGFTVRREDEASDTVPAGSVIRTEPAEGTSAPEGSEVVLFVSTGPETVTVPDVLGLTQAEAEAAITAVELVPVVGSCEITDPTTQAPGTVIQQTPNPGSEALPGAQVSLCIGVPPPTPTPEPTPTATPEPPTATPTTPPPTTPPPTTPPPTTPPPTTPPPTTPPPTTPPPTTP